MPGTLLRKYTGSLVLKYQSLVPRHNLRIHLDLQLIKQGYYSKLQLHKLFPKKYPGSKIRKACFEICPATLSQT
jgi:hypothetical protein